MSRSPNSKRRRIDSSVSNDGNEEDGHSKNLRPRQTQNQTNPYKEAHNLRPSRKTRIYIDEEDTMSDAGTSSDPHSPSKSLPRKAKTTPKVDYNAWAEKLHAQQGDIVAEFSLDAKEFDLNYACKTGLKKPILFTGQLEELGMKIPEFNYREILNHLKANQKTPVYNHLNDDETDRCISTVVREIEKPLNERHGTYSFSFNFSKSPLAKYVEVPYVVSKLDWGQTIFPRELMSYRRYNTTNKYFSMSMAGSFGDFHTEFSACTTWQYVQSGYQEYFLIRPTDDNMTALEDYHNREHDGQFFAKFVNKCNVIRVNATQTLMIPAGWIYAVYSPVDCLVYSGNFLHDYSLDIQLKIYRRDKGTINEKYQYEYYDQFLWYFVADFVKKATGLNYIGLVHSREYDDLLDQKETDKKFVKTECYNVEGIDFYDKKSRASNPYQEEFDSDAEEDLPKVKDFNREFLQSVKTSVRADLKKLLFDVFNHRLNNIHNDTENKVAEGIRRPKHLLHVFKLTIDQMKTIPYTAKPLEERRYFMNNGLFKKDEPCEISGNLMVNEPSQALEKEEPSEVNGNLMGDESPSTLPSLEPTNDVPRASSSAFNDSSHQQMEVENEIDDNNSLAHRLRALNHEGHYDCVFECNGKEFRVFKNVLMCNSEHFKHNLKFNDECIAKTKVNEYDPLSVKRFIDYLYFGHVDNFELFAIDLFELATKYSVEKLKAKCLPNYMSSLNQENILSRIIFATANNEEELRDYLIAFAKSNQIAHQLIKTEEWRKLVYDNLEMSNEIIDRLFA